MFWLGWSPSPRFYETSEPAHHLSDNVKRLLHVVILFFVLSLIFVRAFSSLRSLHTCLIAQAGSYVEKNKIKNTPFTTAPKQMQTLLCDWL